MFELPLTCSTHAPPVLDACSPGEHDPITVCVGVHSCLSVLTSAHSPETSDVSLIGTLYLCSPPSPDPVHSPCRKTEGYSCSDLTSLARDAAFGPIRGSTSHLVLYTTLYTDSSLTLHVQEVCVWWTRCACVCLSLALHVSHQSALSMLVELSMSQVKDFPEEEVCCGPLLLCLLAMTSLSCHSHMLLSAGAANNVQRLCQCPGASQVECLQGPTGGHGALEAGVRGKLVKGFLVIYQQNCNN